MTRPQRRLAPALVALVLAGVVTPTAAGADDFVTQANTICQSSRTALAAVPRPKDNGDILRYMRRALPIAERQYRDLRRLHPPAELQARVHQALALGARETKIARRLVHALEGGANPVQAFKALARDTEAMGHHEDRLWRSVGADRCAS
jgi:hypothetical protein